MSLQLAQFTPDDAIRYWPSFEKALDRVPFMWRAEITKEEIFSGLADGSLQLWGVQDAKSIILVFVTKVHFPPSGGTLSIMWSMGNGVIDEALPIISAGLERFAQSYNLKFAKIVGRPGWIKKLRPFGFTLEHVTLIRAIHEGRMQ